MTGQMEKWQTGDMGAFEALFRQHEKLVFRTAYLITGSKEAAEEISQLLPQMPGFGFMDFELYPLADFDEGIKNFLEGLKKAAQAVPK